MSVSKGHKRDRTTRAWNKGYQAGFLGRSQEHCPHQSTSARDCWLDGWTVGHQEGSDGAVAMSGLHKRTF